MSLMDIQQELVKKTIRQFYLFIGEEVKVMDLYIDKIANVMNTPVIRTDSVATIFSSLKNTGIITAPKCILIRDDKDYTKQEQLWQGFIKGELQGINTIIMAYSSIDKRSKFYKHHVDMLTDFIILSDEVLAGYIKHEIGLEKSLAIQLANMCDNNYSKILLECDKLYHLSKANNINSAQAFNLAIQEKLIYTNPKDVVFDLLNAICRRESAIKCFNLYYELIQVVPSPLGLLSLLYTNFRAMLLVNSTNNTGISEKTGLTGWQIKCAKDHGRRYSLVQLVEALKLINKAEQGIKMGKMDSDMAIPYILSKIL